MKKTIIVIFVIFVLAVSTNVFAAPFNVPDATIHLVGDSLGQGFIQISGTGMPLRQFYLQGSLKNEHLAIILTAASLGRTCYVRVADPAVNSLVMMVSLSR